MNKKLFFFCAGMLLGCSFTATAMAADAVTVYVEPASATYTLYQPDNLPCRATFLDAAGQLATTFAGSQIGDSVLELKSANYSTEIAFNPGSPINISNDGYQEFEITYNPAAITTAQSSAQAVL